MSKPDWCTQEVWETACVLQLELWGNRSDGISGAEFDQNTETLARAIMAATLAERTDERVKEILHAVLDCPHEIEGAEIRLRRSERQQGNATSQLHDRIAASIRKREA